MEYWRIYRNMRVTGYTKEQARAWIYVDFISIWTSNNITHYLELTHLPQYMFKSIWDTKLSSCVSARILFNKNTKQDNSVYILDSI